MMQGTIALVGSGEYLPEMEPVDRWLLQRLPATPRVACLPTAAGTEGQARIRYWMDLGVKHFQRLGARAEGVPVIDRPTAEDPECAEHVRMANFVYLSGGKPTYLYDTLVGTAVWEAILDVLAAGGVLAGCSAGAMICGQQSIPWGRHPGFNLVPGAVIMPHYDELPGRFATLLKLWLARRATLVGVDGNTALVLTQFNQDELAPDPGSDGIEPVAQVISHHLFDSALRLQIIGAGAVTIWGPSGPARYTNGDQLLWGA